MAEVGAREVDLDGRIPRRVLGQDGGAGRGGVLGVHQGKAEPLRLRVLSGGGALAGRPVVRAAGLRDRPGSLRPAAGAEALVLVRGRVPVPGPVGCWSGGSALAPVETDQFGGFLLTLIIGVTGISFSLPIGIALALGRTSSMPVLRILCVAVHRVHPGGAADSLSCSSPRPCSTTSFPPGTSFDLLMRGADHGHPVRLRLYRGGGKGRPAGGSEGAGGGGGLARPLLLEGAAAGRPAPSVEDLDPGHREYLHRALQGHHPGAHHRHAGPPRHRPRVARGRGLGGARARGVPVHRGLLLSCAASGCRATRCTSNASSTPAGRARSESPGRSRTLPGPPLVRGPVPAPAADPEAAATARYRHHGEPVHGNPQAIPPARGVERRP